MATFTVTPLGSSKWGDSRANEAVPVYVSFSGMAVAFTQGASVLLSADPPNPVAAVWLLSQATENILKAWLSRNGKPKVLNDRDVWHDLEALWTLAQGDGLDIDGQQPEWLIYLANTHRGPYANRYAKGQVLVMHADLMPHARETERLVQLVLARLDQHFRQ